MQSSSTGTERRLLWIGFLTVGTLLMTGVFACAVPFAALAALAAFDTDRRDGLLLIGAVWLANQIYGFAVLGYPHEAQAYYWGLTMLFGAVAGYYAARAVVSALAPSGALVAVIAALPVAFIAYEAVLYVASLVLSNGEGAFNTDVVAYVTLVEVVAFLALLIAHRLAVAAGLVEPERRRTRDLERGSFKSRGRPAAMKITRSAAAATRWLRRPCASRKARPSGVSGTSPKPTSFETATSGPGAEPSAASRRSLSVSTSPPASITLLSHSVRQSISAGPAMYHGPARSSGASTRLPIRVAARAMMG